MPVSPVLNCCKPNGIPIIVTHKAVPNARCSSARGRPDTISQMIFKRNEPAPPPYCTSFPKGKKLSAANLKHCIPTGIPTTVIHQRQPARHQLSPLTAPPNTNHNTFPRHPICYTSPFIRFFTSASIFSIRLMASSTCSLASAILLCTI